MRSLPDGRGGGQAVVSGDDRPKKTGEEERTDTVRKSMKIREILGLKLGEETHDALDLFLVERFSKLVKEQTEKSALDGGKERLKELEGLVMDHYSEDKQKCEVFLDQMADLEAEQKEEIYLHGIRDGIRAAKQFMEI